jgi:hypothetical protein
VHLRLEQSSEGDAGPTTMDRRESMMERSWINAGPANDDGLTRLNMQSTAARRGSKEGASTCGM